MQYHHIPYSLLEVSVLGLGTMAFSEQNTQANAHVQLDYALAAGINLIDTAEMYPVPPRPETQRLTEHYIVAVGSRHAVTAIKKCAGQ